MISQIRMQIALLYHFYDPQKQFKFMLNIDWDSNTVLAIYFDFLSRMLQFN